MNTNRNLDVGDFANRNWLWILIISAVFLTCRLGYYYISDVEYFPINMIKIAANYEHVTHKEIEDILSKHTNESFFTLSLGKLEEELNAMNWVGSATVERIWPDALKIQLVEKKPVAIWDNSLMTAEGELLNEKVIDQDTNLPHLKGPLSQQIEVLQVYEKLSKILTEYGLKATGLQLRENQSWVLFINDKIKIKLGKKDLSKRVLLFCKAYPAVFSKKMEQLLSVDLRYPGGMAVEWQQQSER